MRVVDFVQFELVAVGLDAADARSALAQLTARLDGDATQRERVVQALWEREEAHTTALASGIAVPHATLPGLPRPVLGIGTCAAPIRFGSAGLPVRVVFLLLSPPEQSQLHIKLLARIARVARRPHFVDRLAAARSPAELLHALEAEEFDP